MVGSYPLVSLSFKLKDLLGPVTRVKKKKKQKKKKPHRLARNHIDKKRKPYRQEEEELSKAQWARTLFLILLFLHRKA